MGCKDLKVRWTRPALSDFIEAQEFIARDDPQAASRTAERLWEAAEHLTENPHIGRKGHVAGTRELVVTRTPYLIVYRTRDEVVEILRIWHGRRNWQNERGAE